jgi:hypothetical protein
MHVVKVPLWPWFFQHFGLAGNLGLERGGNFIGEIFEVDGRETLGRDGVELHFVAGGNAEQANLAGGVIHAD